MQNPMYKKAAEELLKLADDIEKEASEKIFFACDSCEHKVNLATINSKRKTATEGSDKNVVIAAITVEDKVRCPECTGKMAYAPTEESEKYLVEAEDKSNKEPEDYDSMKEDEKKKEDKPVESAKKETESCMTEEVESKKKKEGGIDEELEKSKDPKFDKDSGIDEDLEKSKDPIFKKASEMGLDLDAVARYANF